MNDSNEKLLLLKRLAERRDRKQLELAYLLHFAQPTCLPNDWRKESGSEEAI